MTRSLLVRSLSALALCGLPHPTTSEASTPMVTLASDIDSIGAFSRGFFEDARRLELIGDRVLFAATELGSGDGVWSTDGTAEGTHLLFPSLSCCNPYMPQMIGRANDLSFWVANGDFDLLQLWSTDGTRAGTQLLAGPGTPLKIGFGNYVPDFESNGDLLFFGANQNGEPPPKNLWASDGTPAGTRQLADLPDGLFSGDPREYEAAGDAVFFRYEGNLWVSDGTASGTRDLAVHARWLLGAVGDRLLFLGLGTGGPALWVSDGTQAGTESIYDLGSNPFPLLQDYEEPAVRFVGNQAYLALADPTFGDELWTTDGTAAGTRRLTNLEGDYPFGCNALLSRSAPLRGQLILLVTENGLNQELALVSLDPVTGRTEKLLEGFGLAIGSIPTIYPGLRRVGDLVYFRVAAQRGKVGIWATDGTREGTREVSPPGTATFQLNPPALVGEFGNNLVYTIANGNSVELWRTDGTPEGRVRITNFTADGPAVPGMDSVVELDGTLFFTSGRGIWRSQGNLSTTRLVSNFSLERESSLPFALVAANGGLFYGACDRNAENLFFLDGNGNTLEIPGAQLEPSCHNSVGSFLVASDGFVFYTVEASSFSGTELWRSDGTPNGTIRLVEDFNLNMNRNIARTSLDRLFFSHEDELWVSDGTLGGTRRVDDLTDEFTTLASAAFIDGKAYFYARLRGSYAYQAYVSDGTAPGTRALTAPGPHCLDCEFFPFMDRVYFPFEQSGAGVELWSTDGTPEGTAMVGDLRPGYESSSPRELTEMNGALYFFATVEGFIHGLWRLEGEGELPTLVRTFADFSHSSDFSRRPFGLTAFEGALFFAPDDEQQGRELWTTDGTPGGTRILANLAPGDLSSSPEDLTATPGGLYFSATDGKHGRELWRTDGTAAGTHLVQDLFPGVAGSRPRALTRVEGSLLFAADDGVLGGAIWRVDPTGEPGCVPSSRHLCLQNGRFRVEAVWRDFEDNRGLGTAERLTADTGYFWFFRDANVETVVKVLDGNPINHHFWTFFGALSNVEYALTVTDSETGAARRYYNPRRRFASVGDTESFGPKGAKSAVTESNGTSGEPLLADHYFDPAVLKAGCVSGPHHLCLNQGRFRVGVLWENFASETGNGTAVPLTEDTGYFWFFRDTNVEVILKVLDGRPVNGSHWVFYGALSNVAYRITVTDTETGEVKVYENPLRRFASVGDTTAFSAN